MKKNVTIVTPVYNDWECLNYLVSDIAKTLENTVAKIHVLAVNDCSTELPPEVISLPPNVTLERIDLITNIGHQRAIVIGLCHCFEKDIDTDFIIVMDSDGEDKPTYIMDLIGKCESSGGKKVIFAKRAKRSETWMFKRFYAIYKFVFKLLTGASISFGNFSCIPKSILFRICNEPNFWNHYSSAMIKSKIPFDNIPTERGERYTGTSKMNFNNLILHGLSSLSVYIESIIVRILKLNFIVFLLLITSFISVTYIKYFTTLAIPGWATYIFGFLFSVLITIGLFSLLIILTHLNSRNKPIVGPLSFYKTLIQK